MKVALQQQEIIIFLCYFKRYVVFIMFVLRYRSFVLKASSINNKMVIFWIGSKLGENLFFIIVFEYKVMLER